MTTTSTPFGRDATGGQAPRLGLHRVLGGQRPHHAPASSCPPSASAAPPTPGPRPGVRDKASYVLEQGDIRFVVSGALTADSPIAAHVRTHGDGVHDLAWLVDDADGRVRRGRGPRRPAGARSLDRDTTTTASCELATSRHLRRDRCTPSSTGAAIAAECSSRATAPTTCHPTPGDRPSACRASTTSSATSSRAGSTTGCASTGT